MVADRQAICLPVWLAPSLVQAAQVQSVWQKRALATGWDPRHA